MIYFTKALKLIFYDTAIKNYNLQYSLLLNIYWLDIYHPRIFITSKNCTATRWDALFFRSRGFMQNSTAYRARYDVTAHYDILHCKPAVRFIFVGNAKYNGTPAAAVLNRSWLATACVICYRGQNEFIAYFSQHNFRPGIAGR